MFTHFYTAQAIPLESLFSHLHSTSHAVEVVFTPCTHSAGLTNKVRACGVAAPVEEHNAVGIVAQRLHVDALVDTSTAAGCRRPPLLLCAEGRPLERLQPQVTAEGQSLTRPNSKFSLKRVTGPRASSAALGCGTEQRHNSVTSGRTWRGAAVAATVANVTSVPDLAMRAPPRQLRFLAVCEQRCSGTAALGGQHRRTCQAGQFVNVTVCNNGVGVRDNWRACHQEVGKACQQNCGDQHLRLALSNAIEDPHRAICQSINTNTNTNGIGKPSTAYPSPPPLTRAWIYTAPTFKAQSSSQKKECRDNFRADIRLSGWPPRISTAWHPSPSSDKDAYTDDLKNLPKPLLLLLACHSNHSGNPTLVHAASLWDCKASSCPSPHTHKNTQAVSPHVPHVNPM
eukprot:1158959-Pelagomonas_calceolata.AAC.6